MNYQLIQGDCIETMKGLEAGSVQCVVTSPPYFGLRDYGTATWEGGDPECDHIAGMDKPRSSRPLGAFHGGDDKFHVTPFKDLCRKCGARRIDNQIGLEPSVDEYVQKLVDVFREVRRLLRDDGTLWLNLGDSYNGSGGAGGDYGVGGLKEGQPKYPGRNVSGLKPKDLIGIPWRCAFALQADGWYLRSDIIWSKPNPMPESVTDRPTKAHEYIFLLSKSAQYFYDADAVREPQSQNTIDRFGSRASEKINPRSSAKERNDYADPNGENSFGCNALGRNRRSVWTVTTKPYSGAHFATFPPDLIEPCILAGSKPGDTVLDCFNGSGTTGAVSLKHGRRYIGLELNPEYVDLSHERIAQSQPMLLPIT